jgi:glycine/D-amino acid oxidase-like deaminating enzyme/nitrite reductase/ring-hydroxylating ferredoxin subunit
MSIAGSIAMSKHAIPNDSGISQSVWMEHDVPDPGDSLAVESDAVVCVVGAGMAGLSVAYGLVSQGLRVIVVDDGPIGGGESARTSAHLASAIDDRFSRLEKWFGEDGARLAAESHAAAIDAIETNVRELEIECDFRRVDGYLFSPPKSNPDDLDRELEAARRAGLVVEREESAPLPFDTGPCLRFANQAEFHPIAYLAGLARAIEAAGGEIHTGVHVSGIEPGDITQVRTRGGKVIHARVVVDATNATISSMVKLPIRQAAYRTYCIALDIARGVVPHGLYWDTADPYHYIRIARGEGGREVLIVGGEDHKTGQDHHPAVRWSKLVEWTRGRFPQAGAVIARWSGQVMEPADGLGFIGKSPDMEHVYVVTGDSGNGLTHAAIAGLLLPDVIRGRPHPWAALYDPHRTSLHGFGTLMREAANMTAQYVDWLRTGEIADPDELAPGQAAIVRRGVHLIAAYRDDGGTCHLRSAKCPHLGGVVAWNPAERTWDCPCHGSRFDAYGRVLNGPAVSDLPALDDEPPMQRRERRERRPTPRAGNPR